MLVVQYAIKVRKNQELVQLWHGPGAYKKFGHSRGNGDLKNSTVHPGYKRYTKAIVTTEEHNVIGGLGSAVAEVLAYVYHLQGRTE